MRPQHRSSRHRRSGLSLLEVLAALVIFLLSLIALSQLMDVATKRARDVQYQSEGTLLAQSKLAEFVAGIESVSTGGSGDFEDEAGWTWSAESTADSSAQGLYKVTIKVTHTQGKFEVSLSQYILDPSMRGNLSSSATSSSSSSGSSSSSSGSSSSSSSGSTGSSSSTPAASSSGSSSKSTPTSSSSKGGP